MLHVLLMSPLQDKRCMLLWESVASFGDVIAEGSG